MRSNIDVFLSQGSRFSWILCKSCWSHVCLVSMATLPIYCGIMRLPRQQWVFTVMSFPPCHAIYLMNFLAVLKLLLLINSPYYFWQTQTTSMEIYSTKISQDKNKISNIVIGRWHDKTGGLSWQVQYMCKLVSYWK